MDPRSIEQLLTVAARQHQLVSTDQATAFGVSPTALRVAVERGWLRPVRRGIVGVAGAPRSPWEPIMAAALAAGPDAVVSHRAAAAVHRFNGVALPPPELTVPSLRRVRLAGVRVHRTGDLDLADVQEQAGIRLTTPMRTVIDIAASTDDYLLGRILDDGAVRRLWRAEAVAVRLAELGRSGRAGTVRLRRLLADRMGEGIPDSPFEQRVRRVLKGKVPDPIAHYQVVLDDRVIDMDLAWPEYRIDGEIDGYAWHTQRSDFDRERYRANVLARNGWRLVHWTSTMGNATILDQVLPYFAGGESG